MGVLRMRAVLQVVAVLAMAAVPEVRGRAHQHVAAHSHTDDLGCTRDRKIHNIFLDSSRGTVYRHFDNGAYMQSMVFKSGHGCDGPNKFGFDTDKVTIWATGGCTGIFEVDYVCAYCTNITMNDPKNSREYWNVWLNNPCYQIGSSYRMVLLKDHTGHCGDMDGDHTGLGNHYGFSEREVWSDNYCCGDFMVCEVGKVMEERDDTHDFRFRQEAKVMGDMHKHNMMH